MNRLKLFLLNFLSLGHHDLLQTYDNLTIFSRIRNKLFTDTLCYPTCENSTGVRSLEWSFVCNCLNAYSWYPQEGGLRNKYRYWHPCLHLWCLYHCKTTQQITPALCRCPLKQAELSHMVCVELCREWVQFNSLERSRRGYPLSNPH